MDARQENLPLDNPIESTSDCGMNFVSRERDPSAAIPSALFLLFTPHWVASEVIAGRGRGRISMRMTCYWKRECRTREK
jgi:hypothetical protein